MCTCTACACASQEGFELTVGTNHIGHFALAQQLLPSLSKGTAPRPNPNPNPNPNPDPKPNPNPNPDQADHAHDDMAQDMEGGGAAATSFVQYVTYVGPNGDLFVSGSVRATP